MLCPREAMNKSHQERTGVARAGERAREKRVPDTPHVLGELSVEELDLSDDVEGLAEPHQNQLRT